MTNSEIKKAVECCANEGFQDCKNCPLNIPHQPCSKVKLPRISLDLINRYEAEIERLQETKERLMYSLEAVLDERADHTDAIAEVFSRIESECIDTFGNFNYKAYLYLKCDMMKGR